MSPESLSHRWLSILTTDHFNTGDMNVPTFYCTDTGMERDELASIFVMPVVGVVFGGIHCIGWFFSFPSSDEAMMWRISSAVLTGTAFILPIFLSFVFFCLFFSEFFSRIFSSSNYRRIIFTIFFSIILLVYVVSRLLLLGEAFISLRHLTPGMLVLAKWTSFVPHI